MLRKGKKRWTSILSWTVLNTRYVEEGTGDVLLLLHGASLGSSLEVFEKNLPVFAKARLRAIAFDSPGYGLTDNPHNHTDSYRTEFVVKFMNALDIAMAHLVSHSATRRMAAKIAAANPQPLGKVIPVAATPLIPPLPESEGKTRDGSCCTVVRKHSQTTGRGSVQSFTDYR